MAEFAPLDGVEGGAASLRHVRTTEIAGVGPVVRFAQLLDEGLEKTNIILKDKVKKLGKKGKDEAAKLEAEMAAR